VIFVRIALLIEEVLFNHPAWFFGGLAIIFAVCLPIALRRRRRQDRIAALEAQVCPDCGYDVRGTAPSSSPANPKTPTEPAMRICPECGAVSPLEVDGKMHHL
jgi:hypothetical protein